MPGRLARSLAFLLLACALPLALASCSKSSSPKTHDTGGGGGNADSLVQLANAQLASILYAQINSAAPTRPSDLNYSAPEQLYRQALTAAPSNADANFGVAALGLMSLSYDPTVNAAFDAWSAYLQNHVPFQTTNSQRQLLGVRTSLAPGVSGLRLPYELVPLSMLAELRGGQTASDPQLSTVQDILSTRALPKLLDAIAHLTTAAAQPGYVFTITPHMQGDDAAPPILVHANDLIALRAGAELLAAGCEVATAYDLNFATYDSTGLVAALRPGSGWLSLVGGNGATGAARLSDARGRLLSSIADARTVLSTLLTQTGNHDYDLVKIPPGPRGRIEAESLQVHLDTATQALSSGYTWVADWDGDRATPDVPVTIRFDHLFTTPVHDLKSLLPAYTATAVRRPYQLGYTGDYKSVNVQAYLPTSGYFNGDYSVSVWPDSSGSTSWYGADSLFRPLRAAVQSEVASLRSQFGNVVGYSLDAYFYGYCNAGYNTITVSIQGYVAVSQNEVFVPALVWNANSVSGWIWPDPTMGGALPGITSTSQFLTTFGFRTADWTKTQVLDWTTLAHPYYYWW